MTTWGISTWAVLQLPCDRCHVPADCTPYTAAGEDGIMDIEGKMVRKPWLCEACAKIEEGKVKDELRDS